MGYYCFGKYKVASGVYMILYRQDGVETKVKKSNDYPLNFKHACKFKSDSSFVNKISGKSLIVKCLLSLMD
jgi:hypothetical protein